MSTRFLHHFFEPRSAAVFGASEKPESLGGLVLGNLQEGGFRGKLWAVNLKGYETVFGVDCVRTVDELPEVPDLAVVCSPIDFVPKLIKKLGKFGVKAALVLSGGAYLDREEGSKGSIRQRT